MTKKTPTLEDILGSPEDTLPPMKQRTPAQPKPPRQKPTGSTTKGTPRKKLPAGQGRDYVAADELEQLTKELRKLRKPISTREFAAAHGVATTKVRQAAYVLLDERKVVLKKVGGSLVIHPK